MKKILLIEDNPDVRENTAEILELADFEVITASDGKDGVEQASSAFPDLTMGTFMNISDAPDGIKKSLKQLTSK